MSNDLIDVRQKLETYEAKKTKLERDVLDARRQISKLAESISNMQNDIFQTETYIEFCRELLGEPVPPATHQSSRTLAGARVPIKKAILELLDGTPDKDFYVTDIAAGISDIVTSRSKNLKNVVRNYLIKMEKKGMVNSGDEGYRKVYWSKKRESLPFNS